jgi:glycosyltransferase involved in cell wall biosynthesis
VPRFVTSYPRMRILQTAHSYPPDVSGVAMVVSNTARRLAAMGNEVHVATACQPLAAANEIADGVFVHRFDIRGNAVTGLHGDLESYRALLKSTEWDVVIMHCAQTWSTDAILPILSELRCGKLFVGHGFSALENPAYNRYFASLAQQFRGIHRVFALSRMLEEPAFCRQHGLPEPLVVPNGVDLLEWERVPLGLRASWGIGSAPWIVSVSNHSTVKQHSAFFDVVGRIRKRLPGAKGTIIGGHYPAAKWNLGRCGIKGGCWYKCRARALVQPSVFLRPNEPRSRVVSAIREADVVLVTSSREAAPLVILESMAAGTPWVSLDVGCVREFSGGIIVTSPARMASVTLDLLNAPRRRAELSRQGRRAAAERHNWDRIAELYEEQCSLVSAAAQHCPPRA